MAMIGVVEHAPPSAMMRRVASMPSITGICMSIRMVSKGCSLAIETASAPSLATTTSWPRRARKRVATSWFTRLSSTSRILRRGKGALSCPPAWRRTSSLPTATTASSNQKMLPTPTVLLMPSSPPSFSTICLQIVSPRPVPPYLRLIEASTCENGLNSLASPASSMPIPVSSTSKRSISLPCR